MKTPNLKSGFTLIELLTVIAIIGILAALIFPTVGKVRETAQRTVDANNLREIVKAATIYAADNNDRLPDPSAATTITGGTGPFLWAGILAQRGLLTDPSFYFAKNDPQFNGSYPAAIVTPADSSVIDSSFVTGRDLSFEFVGGLRMSDKPSTPVAFTRGLLAAGTWDPAKGVYRELGGHVAFLGGNVQFHANTNEESTKLTLNNGTKGVSMLQAIPYNATAALNSKIYGTASAGLGTTAGAAAVSASGP